MFKASQNRARAFYLTLSVLFIVFSNITAEGDEVKLKDDKTFIGRITKEVADGVWLEIANGAEVFFHTSQIESIKKSPIEDKKDIKTPDQIAEVKEETKAELEEEKPKNESEKITDYFGKMKKITEENTRAINDCTAKAKKLLYDLNTNTINLDEFENMIKSEYKKKLDIAIELLDELKSVNPVPPRFEKSHTLSIKSFEERIEETRSRIAGDDDVSRQHGLKATEYEKQAAKETGEGMIDVMKNLIDKVDSVK